MAYWRLGLVDMDMDRGSMITVVWLYDAQE